MPFSRSRYSKLTARNKKHGSNAQALGGRGKTSRIPTPYTPCFMHVPGREGFYILGPPSHGDFPKLIGDSVLGVPRIRILSKLGSAILGNYYISRITTLKALRKALSPKLW